ncbi:DNase I-like protein [Backusella circina FSU 941]|nr:DNase I-like protein [Backusella circina FSU 941]
MSSWTVPVLASRFVSRSRNDPRNKDQSPTTPAATRVELLGAPLRKSSFFTSKKNGSSERLKIFVGTWNMYGRLLPIDLSTFLTERKREKLENIPVTTNNSNSNTHFLLDNKPEHPYHMLVIGTQECERDISEALFYPSKEEWEKRLSEYLGPHYKLVNTETLAALHIAVYVWKPVSYLIKESRSESIKTGWANMVGNKGAVAVSILFGTRSFIFINCHLTAHQSKLSERNANVQRILDELNMPKFSSAKIKTKGKDLSVTDQFDHVFLFGDTNYRINAERPFVFDFLRKGDYQTLLEYDQLSLERKKKGSPISKFNEHPIQFPPTYKLDTLAFNAETSESESDSSPASDAALHRTTTSKSLNNPSTTSSTSTNSKFASRQSIKSTSRHTSSSIKRHLSKKKLLAFPPALTTEQLEIQTAAAKLKKLTSTDPKQNQINVVNTSAVLVYDSSEKQRVPSWTDRILWYDKSANSNEDQSVKKKNTKKSKVQSSAKSLFKRRSKRITGKTICYAYNAVLHDSLLGVSDHMPVIGIFGVPFNDWNEQQQQKNFFVILKKTPTQQTDHEKRKPKRAWWRRLFDSQR